MDVVILLILTGLFAWWGFWVAFQGKTKDSNPGQDPQAH
jgi:hypothetical protein